jgi:ABC-type glycerol-3-phosphate transport system substrate-binding protein
MLIATDRTGYAFSGCSPLVAERYLLGLSLFGSVTPTPATARKVAPVLAALARVTIAVLVVLLLAAPHATVRAATDAAAVAQKPEVLVFVFRAMGGKFVSRDMDDLATAIKAQGFDVQVYNYTGYLRPAKETVQQWRSAAVKPRIIALGHSAGGDSAIRFALALNRAHVPVDLIITLDPTRIANRVPGNVARFINIYSSKHTLGGGDPAPGKDFHGHFVTVDMKNHPDLWHLHMARMAGLQEAVVAKIAEVVAMPPASVEGAVPLEYAPPRDAAVEIWDSAVPVVTGAGETAAMVAAQFGVPAWVVAQVNNVGANDPLAAGRRLLVPRRLAAAAPAN